MRISEKEVRAILDVFGPPLHDIGGKLYLFGSRLDDAKKGGDIDLLIIVPSTDQDRLKDLKVQLIDRLHARIGEQRVDLTVATPELCESDVFLRSIRRKQLI